MKHKNKNYWLTIIFLTLGIFAITSDNFVQACTRAVYLGTDGLVITGRSMDWSEDMQSNLWIFPRGMERDGAAGSKSVRWKSKYGSLVVSCYEAGTADGMNEKGLVANVLYLVEADYGEIRKDKPVLSTTTWAQYVLDNFANVNEAVEALSMDQFQVVSPVLPNGAPAHLHLAISDVEGDSAIFEYIGGKLVIHHGKQYQVMTNSPKYDDQLALDKYWQSIGGQTFLPGTNRAADRFARASFLIKSVPTHIDDHYIKCVPGNNYENQAVASVISVIRSVGVPLGMTTPGQPNISSTIWRAVADQKNKVYYFDSATTPNTFWVSLRDLDFNEDAPVKELTVAGGKVYAGNVAAKFENAKPFTFLTMPLPSLSKK